MDNPRKLLSVGRSLGRNTVAIGVLVLYLIAVIATVLIMVGTTVRLGLFIQSEFFGHLTATTWTNPGDATIGVLLLGITAIVGFGAVAVIGLVLQVVFNVFLDGPLEFPSGELWVGVAGLLGITTLSFIWLLPVWGPVFPEAAGLFGGLAPGENARNASSILASMVPLAGLSFWFLNKSAIASGGYGGTTTSPTGERLQSNDTEGSAGGAADNEQSASSTAEKSRHQSTGTQKPSSPEADPVQETGEGTWSKQEASADRNATPPTPDPKQALDRSKLEYDWQVSTDVAMEDIGGMEAVKQSLDRKVINLLKSSEMRKNAAELDISLPNLLLYGPPGTGKTYLARGLANEIGLPFVKVTGGDITTKWVNESPDKVNNLFREGRKVAGKEGGAVIFLDEMDAVLAERGGINSNRENEKVVNEFLTHLEETNKHDILFIGATNRRDELDPAVTRKGRINEEIEVPEPDHDARVAIFKAQLRARSHALSKNDFQRLASETEGLVAADIEAIVDEASRNLLYDTGNRSQLEWRDFEDALDSSEE